MYIYIYLVVCLCIHGSTNVHYATGYLQGDRYYYDGSIECYHGVHLFYAVISYLLICTIIIPGPFIVVLISYRHFKVTNIIFLSTLSVYKPFRELLHLKM